MPAVYFVLFSDDKSDQLDDQDCCQHIISFEEICELILLVFRKKTKGLQTLLCRSPLLLTLSYSLINF